MITLSDAWRLIDSNIGPLDPVESPLLEAAGCVLAGDVVAPINVPEFANSAMDGIAVRSADIIGNGPWRFPIQRTVGAGDEIDEPLREGYAVKIMTGAALPRGADKIVPVEQVKFENDFAIFETDGGENHVRPAGDDIKKGDVLFKKGEVLGPFELGVLASLGMTSIGIIPRPRIAFFPTGSEIVEPGVPLKPGQIYDANNIVMRALLRQHGFILDPVKRVIFDDPKAISAELVGCLDSHDLIITIGGVSMGDFDFIPKVVRDIGGEIIFHKVAIKPGKPVLLARFGSRWLLGLPGNPVSVAVGYHLFVRRTLARLMGTPYKPRGGRTILGHDVSIHGDRLCLVGTKIEVDTEGRFISYPSIRQKSNRLSSIQGIDGWVFIDGGTKTVPAGTEVYTEWL